MKIYAMSQILVFENPDKTINTNMLTQPFSQHAKMHDNPVFDVAVQNQQMEHLITKILDERSNQQKASSNIQSQVEHAVTEKME